MEVSLLLAEQILTMFLMGFLGFFIVKRGLLTSEDSRILSKICVYVCIPCMIVDSFQIESSPEMMSGLLLAFLVSVIYHIIYIGFCRLFQKPLGLLCVRNRMGGVCLCIYHCSDGSYLDPWEGSDLP